MSNHTPLLESLEPRLMLTTLVGGDVFQYQDANDRTVRIALTGDMIAEFIASDLDGDNNLLLGDLPGRIIESTTGREGTDILGGVGGADGLEVIGTTPITDPLYNFGNFGIGDAVTLQGLASQDAAGDGRTFAFNVTTDSTDRLIVQLVQLQPDTVNNTAAGTVAAMLQNGSLGEDIAAALSGAAIADDVTALAVDPTTGAAHAVAGDQIYAINIYSGTVSAAVAFGAGYTNVQAAAYDSAGNFWVIGQTGGNATIAQVNPATGATVQADTIRTQQGDPPAYANNTNTWSGMAFDGTTVYGVERADDGGGNITSRLYTIDTAGLGGGGNADMTLEGSIRVGETDTDIQCLALTQNALGTDILVGLDFQVDEGTTVAQMLSISLANGAATPLSEPGDVDAVQGLASYTHAGDTRSILYTADGTNLIRGAAPALPMDAEGVSAVNYIQAADFRPSTGSGQDGLLYFVVNYTDGTDVVRERLFTIDTDKVSRSAIQASLTQPTQNINSGDETTVTSLAWEVNAGTATLYAFRAIDDDPDVGQIVTLDPATGAVTADEPTTVEIGGEPVINITGIEFANDDLTAAEAFIYAVQNDGGNSRLLRIDLTTGDVLVLGPLSDPDDTTGDTRGEDIQGLAWNPVLVDPFTGDVGALVGTDATTDELVFIDYRHRFPTADLFAIYISQSSIDSGITIARYDSNVEHIEPVTDDIGQLRVTHAQDGTLILLDAPDNTGGVYLGARTEDISSDVDDEDLRPLIEGTLGQRIGVRAANIDDINDDPDVLDLSAGVVMSENLLSYLSNAPAFIDRQIGQNIDNVGDLAVDYDGNLAVIDNDLVDETGTDILGDQLALVSGTTGNATDVVTVIDSTNGLALSGCVSIDYADWNSGTNTWFTGDQTLYAVYNVTNPVPSQSVGGDFGADNAYTAVTITLGNQTYAVNNNAGTFELHLVERDAAGAITAVTDLGDIVTDDGAGGFADVTEISALEADPITGQLYAVGTVAGAGDQILFTISTVAQDIDGDTNVDELLAVQIGALDAGVMTTGNLIEGLAFQPDGSELYAVWDNAGTDELYTLDTTTGAATFVGNVEIAAASTDLIGIDFVEQDILIGLDDTTDRIVLVDLADPTQTQNYSANPVDADLVGLAVDRDGLVLSIWDDNAANNELWTSTGEEATLGWIDDDPASGTFGTFTAVGALINPVTTNALGGAVALAFAPGEGSIPGQQGLYIVDTTNTFYEIDPTNGELVSAGYALQDADGNAVGINSMDFDAVGNLFGQDRANGRVVNIDVPALLTPVGGAGGTITVGDVVATSDGSLRPTVAGLSYDATGDRYVVVDNATGLLLLGNENADGGQAHDSAVVMTIDVDTDGNLSNDAPKGQNLSEILIGGTTTGRVDLNGSIHTFYNGWLITGTASGLPEGPYAIADNFHVTGDLQNLISHGDLGGLEGDSPDAPQYNVGTDIQVDGKIGQVRTYGTFYGRVAASNPDVLTAAIDPRGIVQYELEDKEIGAYPEESAWLNGSVYRDDGSYDNDTFDTAQYLGTTRNATPGDSDQIVLIGVIESNPIGDNLDYYGLSLMAGQTIYVQLFDTSGFPGLVPGVLDVGVFDPDGRLIATDINDVSQVITDCMTFSIHAEVPGIYRIAIGGAPFDGSVTFSDAVLYQLTITEVGNLGIGAVSAGNHVINQGGTGEAMVELETGDVGAVTTVNGRIQDEGAVIVNVLTDNLRAMVAQEIGYLNGGSWEDGVGMSVGADIGLMRATLETGGLWSFNTDVGGSLQMLDGAGEVFIRNTLDPLDPTGVMVGGGIGVLRSGGDFSAGAGAADIQMNFDAVGNDGILDLLDVGGNLGSMGAGPEIDTGPGGNVRFVRVAGDAYNPGVYGGDLLGTTLDPGYETMITDDGGADIHIDPTSSSIDDLTGLPVDPATGQLLEEEDLPTLTYRALGIVNSGGQAVIDIVSTDGVVVYANSHGVGSFAEIGEIRVQGTGRAVLANPDEAIELEDHPNGMYRDLEVLIAGDIANPIDVFSVVGGNLSRISNTTGGNITNITVDTVDTLYSLGGLGVANETHNTRLDPRRTLEDTLAWVPDEYVFLQQHNGLVINGHARQIVAGGAIGNLMLNGSVAQITANNRRAVDHSLADPTFRGIVAPIFATGDIWRVYIGEGLAPTGNGEFAHSGIFSEGTIHVVYNGGLGSDIRGDIFASGGDVEAIDLDNGSIINADIGSYSFAQSVEYLGGTPVAEVGLISTQGLGGVIGTNIVGMDIGDIVLENGFGLFQSYVSSFGGGGDIGDTVVDGLGIRSVTFEGGVRQGNIVATGAGATVSTLNYADSVRYSELYEYDPLFNQRLNALNDIHLFLGTSVVAPNAQEGIIDQIDAHGVELGYVWAYRIQSTSLTPTSFDFSDSVIGFRTYPIVAGDPDNNSFNNVTITSGSIQYFLPAADVAGLELSIAGAIYNVTINGSMVDSSVIQALGPNGNIYSVFIRGDLSGDIIASGTIGKVIVQGDMDGNIQADSGTSNPYGLTYLRIDGDFTGTATIEENVGTVYIGGSMGALGETFSVNGDLAALFVGMDPAVNGSSLLMDVDVLGNLGFLMVQGDVQGNVFVGGNASFNITADAASPDDLLTGTMVVMGNLYKGIISGGNLDSAIQVGNNIYSLMITGTGAVGNNAVSNNGVIQSFFGNIYTVIIRDGDLNGTVQADTGSIYSLLVYGDLDVSAVVRADSMRYLYVGNDINTSTVEVTNELMKLFVANDVQAGSTLTADSMMYVYVGGDLLGDLTMGFRQSTSTVNVVGNLGGALTSRADTTLLVGGNVQAGTRITLQRDLALLRVGGNLLGDLLVGGKAGTVFVTGDVQQIVFAVGLDLSYFYIGGVLENTLVQVGISRGDDETFGTDDMNEISRMGKLRTLNVVGNATDNVIAAGGDITSAFFRGSLTNTTVSSGFSVGGTAVATVLADATPLANAAEQNAARSGADRQLMRGDFTGAYVYGVMTNSTISAGVDPVDGIFGDANDSVTTSVTGGDSAINYFLATNSAANNNLIADGGINGRRVNGVVNGNAGMTTVDGDVAYVLNDITAGMGNALEAAVGAPITQLTGPVTYEGVTIQVLGAGQVQIYDNAIDNVIDSLGITGTNASTSVRMTTTGAAPGTRDIGRILTGDDDALRQITFDGDLIGDGVAASPDLWLDTPVSTFTIRDFGGNVDGRIGGDVVSMTMRTQGAGDLRVGGRIVILTLTDGADPMLIDTGTVAADILAMSSDAGQDWVYDDTSGNLRQADFAAGTFGVDSVNVVDALGNDLVLQGIDFNGGTSVLYAVAALYNQAPTVQIGTGISARQSSLDGLAVNSSDEVFAVQDATYHTSGDLGVDTNEFLDLAVMSDGTLYGLRDNAGTLELYAIDRDAQDPADRITLVGAIEDGGDALITAFDIDAGIDSATGDEMLYIIGTNGALAGDMALFQFDDPEVSGELTQVVALNDAGPVAVTDSLLSIAFNSNSTSLYVVRDVAGTQTLYTVDIDATSPDFGILTEVDAGGAGGAIEDGAGNPMDIVGLDLDAAGNLIAIDASQGAGNYRTVRINANEPTQSWIVDDDQVIPDFDGLATNADGYLYTIDDDGANPDAVYESLGADYLVQIDTTTGLQTVVGQIRGRYNELYWDNVETLAFNDGGTLYGIIRDRDGVANSFAATDGAGLVAIQSADGNGDGIVKATSPQSALQPAIALDDGGAVTDEFNAMAVNAAGTVYAIRRVGAQDSLVTLNTTTGALTTIGAAASVDFRDDVNGVAIGVADTDIVGMGFDQDGDLIAYNNTGARAELILVDLANPANSELISVAGALDTGIDDYALGRNGANFLAFGYNSDYADAPNDRYGLLWTNPGTVATLGQVEYSNADPDYGTFFHLRGTASDRLGTATTTTGLDIAVDDADTNHLFVTFQGGQLGEYDVDGSLVLYPEGGDTPLAGAADLGGHRALLTTNGDHDDWTVGTELQNDIGNGDDWIGTITQVLDSNNFVVTLGEGLVADVLLADGVELRYGLGAYAPVTDANTGDALQVRHIDFDGATLIGLDDLNDQAVTIDEGFAADLLAGTDPATATSRTERGSLDATDLTAMGNNAGTYYAFRSSDSTFVQFKDNAGDPPISQLDLGGIVAGSVSVLRITGGANPYRGRIVTTGNSFTSVSVAGGFAGKLFTHGDIISARFTGDFSGDVYAGGDLYGLTVSNGNVTDDALINVGGWMGTLNAAGDFDGRLVASSLTIALVGGAADGQFDVAGQVRVLRVGGQLGGIVNLGSAGTVIVSGNLTADAEVNITGAARYLNLAGNLAAGSSVNVTGESGTLVIGGQLAGTVGIDGGLNYASLGSANAGILAVGQDLRVLSVTGDVDASVLSAGVTLGADGLYNTADDTITGGSILTAIIGGHFYDSALVAGVLPDDAYGPGVPGDPRVYTGDDDDPNNIEDSAEAGGILPSSITTAIIRGGTINPATLRRSAIGAADSVTRVTLSTLGAAVWQREYTDPVGQPFSGTIQIVDAATAKIYFTEPLNSASLILSVDIDDDGAFDSIGDVEGSVTLTDADDNIIDDVTLLYSTELDENGNLLGVLTIRKNAGTFGNAILTATLNGAAQYPGSPVIYGRSGLRSARMDLVSTATQTIINGNVISLPFGDRPGTFGEAEDEGVIQLTENTLTTVGNEFSGFDDQDVYYFEADAWQFMGLQYNSETLAQMALFHRDTQGTVDPSDDTYEAMARWEMMEADQTEMWVGYELPHTGEYYLVLTPMTVDPSANLYTINVLLSSDDTTLINEAQMDIEADDIAYVSNAIGEHNNNQSANTPTQLVYLNFDGGTTTKYAEEFNKEVTVEAFDLADIDPELAGNENTIIFGGGGVTGIIDNILAIFQNTAASYPANPPAYGSGINTVYTTNQADWTAATEGIYFTTVDPSTWGLDEDTDFTTAFIGEADSVEFTGADLLGIASNIDLAGQSKADNAVVFAQALANYGSPPADITARLNHYSYALANVIAHELGHTFGLNHQPTDFINYELVDDDPDNNPANGNDCNTGPGLMAYVPADVETQQLLELGTAPLTSTEFPIGDIDTQDLLIRWFS